MKHPPYHLRVNKAVDRAALVEAIGILVGREPMAKYRYYGMGGPFLDEHRLLYELYPKLRLVSIEKNEDTYRRQQFHRPCSEEILELRHETFRSFLRTYDFQEKKSVVWIDYTDIKYEHIEDFIVLLQKLARGSMVKITLRAHAQDYRCDDAKAEFRREFEEVLRGSAAIPARTADFAVLVQQIMRTATQRAFRGVRNVQFQPVSALYYRDTVGMYTLTGVICSASGARVVRKKFAGWRFANTRWAEPVQVDLPELTTRERQHLQVMLPCRAGGEGSLQERLGYLIDRTPVKSRDKLRQWALYHRYAVEFVKASP